jgi:hypothetical protein
MIDIVVPICNTGYGDYLYRLNAINNMISLYIDKFHIILIEQIIDNDNERYIDGVVNKDNLVYKNVFFNVFNKAWLLNIGAKLATSEYIGFGDVDCMPQNIDSYLCSLEDYIIKKYDFIFGWNKLITLDVNGNFLDSYDLTCGAWGGLVFFNNNFLNKKFFGYNEFLYSSASYDVESIIRLRHLTPIHILNETILHYYHPRNPLKNIINTSNDLLIDYVNKHTNKSIVKLSSYKLGEELPLSEKYNVDNFFYDGVI